MQENINGHAILSIAWPLIISVFSRLRLACSIRVHSCSFVFTKGREGVKWELGFAFFGLGKWDLLPLGLGFNHWEWDGKF